MGEAKTREVKPSVCAVDCPDCCSLLVTIEDGRATRLRGNPEHPITRGFLCAKVTQYLEREYHPDRLLYPMRRVGAKGEGRFARPNRRGSHVLRSETLYSFRFPSLE